MIVLLLALFVVRAGAASNLVWHADKEVLDADLTDAPLIPTLEDLAHKTGWHIFLEPTPGKTFTSKFTGLPRGQAMRILIGDMNYAFVPSSEGLTKLFIFRTSRNAASVEIKAQPEPKPETPIVKKVGNQLIVKLRPGTKIEDLAAKLGATVKARIGELNAYLLEFKDADAMEAARKELASSDGVDSVDYNYYVEPPPTPQKLDRPPVGPIQLALNPQAASGRVVVGLVDTAVQNLPADLQQFLLQQISVAGESGSSDLPMHGTSMAETILRALQLTTGGNTSVRILPVDVYGANTDSTTFDVANGIIRAVNGGATIVNLSLGSDTDSPFLHSVIQQVTAQQIAVFGAAGNTPVTTSFYPAAYPEVIAVTASAGQGQLASYANRGSFVDMMAPGSSIVFYNGQAWMVNGTSAASAYAAGLAAGFADTHQMSSSSAADAVRTWMPFTDTGTAR